MNSNSNDEQMYFNVQCKTDIEHIKDNPDTYIGSVELTSKEQWVLSETCDKIEYRNMDYIPGLFKLFDEGIVNCRDHFARMNDAVQRGVPNSLPVSYIDVSISDDGIITMTNDGNGMDVAKHPETGIWIPELIFGHLRTSTNYNKSEQKIVGGKNGFGFKLVLVWSTYGLIETVDHVRGLKYVQEFKTNLDEICPPKISKCTKAKPYTKIVFKPDYARLGIPGLSSDMISLMKKRIYDVSAVTDKSVKVKYGGDIIPIKNFEQYIDLYIGGKTVAPRVYENAGPRWEYAVAISPTDEFAHVSFVNGICTNKGGKHVDYILNKITRKLVDYIELKKKVKVAPATIKEQIILFIRCDIVNPAFDSQTKDYMETPVDKFGSSCEVSDDFIDKIAKKLGIMETACALMMAKDNQDAAKKSKGKKTTSIRGIPKLDDANFAGTAQSNLCTLILCEGDSAKTGIVAGLSSSDRDTIGIYPLKGKLMNVRGELNNGKIADNKEITEIMKILGLEMGGVYETIDDVHKKLRYSRVLFMTDQDLDGSHIKGLCINLFHCQWHSLTQIPGFIGFMNTPILKARKGDKELRFYNDGEYNMWKTTEPASHSWSIKYYKGLGTSTKKEFQEYFAEKKYVGFQHNGEISDNAVDMAFNKKRPDDRKVWLETVYDRNSFIDTTQKMIPYEDFINKELVQFSKYDCDRSIPNLMDGLKTSLRKILFSAFKKRLTSEIKVAQFSGYVSEHSCYHHGEESLNKAIVGMAQNFVGSNNINLLVPAGQFGSRIMGGDDSASPRYIFTYLEQITRLLFPVVDDNVLQYLDDDGTPVEPMFYAPIIPMVLVNGVDGIGTGFSSKIMSYNPLQIIQYLKEKLTTSTATATEQIEFTPYYEGFMGSIVKLDDTKYMFKGVYNKLDENTIRVTELPVGYWTQDFKVLIEELMEDKKIEQTVNNKKKKKDSDDDSAASDKKTGKSKKTTETITVLADIKSYVNNNTDTKIDTTIVFRPGRLAELEGKDEGNGCNGVHKLLKLMTTKSTTNMNLFNAQDKLTHYDNIKDIIDDYFEVRLAVYSDRKKYIIDTLEKQLKILSNKARFIQEMIDGTIDIRKKKKDEIVQMLTQKGYEQNECDEFQYLLKMPFHSLTEENVTSLNEEHANKQEELNTISSITIGQLWLNDLSELETAYVNYTDLRRTSQEDDLEIANAKKQTKKVKKVIKK